MQRFHNNHKPNYNQNKIFQTMSNQFCKYCKKTNHTIDTCFKLTNRNSNNNTPNNNYNTNRYNQTDYQNNQQQNNQTNIIILVKIIVILEEIPHSRLDHRL